MRRLFGHRQLDDKLRKSEARYRTVLDTAFDAIVTITPDGVVRWFNRVRSASSATGQKRSSGSRSRCLCPKDAENSAWPSCTVTCERAKRTW